MFKRLGNASPERYFMLIWTILLALAGIGCLTLIGLGFWLVVRLVRFAL